MPQKPPSGDPSEEDSARKISEAMHRSSIDNLRVDMDNMARLYLSVKDRLDTSADWNEDEKKIIRKILDERKRRAWLWASMRIWGGWFVAVVTFYTLTREPVNRIIKALFAP